MSEQARPEIETDVEDPAAMNQTDSAEGAADSELAKWLAERRSELARQSEKDAQETQMDSISDRSFDKVEESFYDSEYTSEASHLVDPVELEMESSYTDAQMLDQVLEDPDLNLELEAIESEVSIDDTAFDNTFVAEIEAGAVAVESLYSETLEPEILERETAVLVDTTEDGTVYSVAPVSETEESETEVEITTDAETIIMMGNPETDSTVAETEAVIETHAETDISSENIEVMESRSIEQSVSESKEQPEFQTDTVLLMDAPEASEKYEFSEVTKEADAQYTAPAAFEDMTELNSAVEADSIEYTQRSEEHDEQGVSEAIVDTAAMTALASTMQDIALRVEKNETEARQALASLTQAVENLEAQLEAVKAGQGQLQDQYQQDKETIEKRLSDGDMRLENLSDGTAALSGDIESVKRKVNDESTEQLNALHQKLSGETEALGDKIGKIGHAVAVMAARIDGWGGQSNALVVTQPATEMDSPATFADKQHFDNNHEDHDVAPHIAQAERELNVNMREEIPPMDLFDRIAAAAEGRYDAQRRVRFNRAPQSSSELGNDGEFSDSDPERPISGRVEATQTAPASSFARNAIRAQKQDMAQSVEDFVEDYAEDKAAFLQPHADSGSFETDSDSFVDTKVDTEIAADNFDQDGFEQTQTVDTEDSQIADETPIFEGATPSVLRKKTQVRSYKHTEPEEQQGSISTLRQRLRHQSDVLEQEEQEQKERSFLGNVKSLVAKGKDVLPKIGKKAAKDGSTDLEDEYSGAFDDALENSSEMEFTEPEQRKPSIRRSFVRKKADSVDADEDWNDLADRKQQSSWIMIGLLLVAALLVGGLAWFLI